MGGLESRDHPHSARCNYPLAGVSILFIFHSYKILPFAEFFILNTLYFYTFFT